MVLKLNTSKQLLDMIFEKSNFQGAQGGKSKIIFKTFLSNCKQKCIKLELLTKIVNEFKPWTIFRKISILDVWQSFEYTSCKRSHLCEYHTFLCALCGSDKSSKENKHIRNRSHMTLARGGRVSHSGFFCIFGQSLLFFFYEKGSDGSNFFTFRPKSYVNDP